MKDIDMETYRYLGCLEGRLDSIRIICYEMIAVQLEVDTLLKAIGKIADLPLRAVELQNINKT